METKLNTNIEYNYDKNDIFNKINKTIDIIKKYIHNNNYQIKGNIDDYHKIIFDKLSLRKMKKIQKYCYWIEKKPTLKRINSFFSILHKYFFIERVNIKISIKEEKIQKARKEWLKSKERILHIVSNATKNKNVYFQ